MKGQKKEISTIQESQPVFRTGIYLSQLNVLFFLSTAQFVKYLLSHITHFAKKPQANADIKALSKSVVLANKDKVNEDIINNFLLIGKPVLLFFKMENINSLLLNLYYC